MIGERMESMRQVAIAFTTTGDKPKEGHRLRELLAVEISDWAPTGGRLHQTFARANEFDGRSFADQFDELDVFIGAAQIVVHDGGKWRRFLRIELLPLKSKGARRMLHDIADVTRWAHQRFPKQRKDLVSLGRRMGLVVSADAAGVARDSELLIGIIGQMGASKPDAGSQRGTAHETPTAAVGSASLKLGRQTFTARLVTCWKILTERV
jgi:hypothetical protein